MPPSPKKKPLPITPWDHFTEAVGPWRNTILVVLAGALLYIGSRIDVVRPWEATVVALLLPIVAIALGLAPLRVAPRVFAVAAVLAVAAGAICELELYSAFFPPAPIASARLTPSHPDADLRIPDAQRTILLEARGHLGTDSGNAGGDYVLSLRRGSIEDSVSGHFERTVRTGRRMMRRMAPSTSVTTHETDVQELELAARGPVHVHLDSLEGNVRQRLDLSVHAPLGLDRWLVIALAGLFLVASIVEGLGARAGGDARFAAAVGAAAALAIYVVHRFDADDPLVTVIAGTIVAVAAGGGGGFVLGALARKLLAKPAPPPAAGVAR
jgi:hypothetical protein